MFKFEKIIVILLYLALFIMISSVSSADYYVNKGTSHENITDWMENEAKTGDSLIFNTSSYKLTDQLVINKFIDIKSFKNTHITFNQEDGMSGMFYIAVKNSFSLSGKNSVSISGLTLNHYGNGNTQYFSGGGIGTTISGTYNSHVNVRNTVINTNLNYGSSISLREGNIINCIINSKSRGIGVFSWKGNIINSRINAKEEGLSNRGIWYSGGKNYWYGDIVNSVIVSGKNGVKSTVWKGKIINSTISTDGPKSDGINIEYGEGRIHRSKITSKDGVAVKISDCVKITNSSLSSRKGLSKTVKYLPDLKVDKVAMYGGVCYIAISNRGYSTSKPTQIGLKVGKVLKIVQIKSIKPYIPELTQKYKTTVKIKLSYKYESGEYMKIVKVDYYNKIKETNKKNNIFKFRYCSIPHL